MTLNEDEDHWQQVVQSTTITLSNLMEISLVSEHMPTLGERGGKGSKINAMRLFPLNSSPATLIYNEFLTNPNLSTAHQMIPGSIENFMTE